MLAAPGVVMTLMQACLGLPDAAGPRRSGGALGAPRGDSTRPIVPGQRVILQVRS
jgi:hypothetical protein